MYGCALLHDKDTITQCRTKIIVSFRRKREICFEREREREREREIEREMVRAWHMKTEISFILHEEYKCMFNCLLRHC